MPGESASNLAETIFGCILRLTYPMKNLFISLLLTLGAITLFSGCSSGVERIGLRVELVKLERKADGSLLASLLFSNPNVGSLNVAKSTHTLLLNGKPAGVLETVEPVGLPAQQAVTSTAVLKRAAGAPEISGTATYQMASLIILSIYDDNTEKYKTSSSGSVVVP
jgi:hypothetical protein